MAKQVGKFRIEDGKFYGPQAYMLEQGNDKLDELLAGENEIFNASAHYSPNIETAILVHMQTDYAGWKGYKEAEGWMSRK